MQFIYKSNSYIVSSTLSDTIPTPVLRRWQLNLLYAREISNRLKYLIVSKWHFNHFILHLPYRAAFLVDCWSWKESAQRRRFLLV